MEGEQRESGERDVCVRESAIERERAIVRERRERV